jgi:competence CoiA-like predicted nuclease
MPLKAKLDGCALVSVLCTEEQWKEAQNASKGDAHRLRMMCCQAPAYATHSPLDLRFFAHKPGFDRCPSEGESDEHESLKGAAAQAVHLCDGWQADVEVSGDGWRADVLAVRGSVKIAIEVQISAQAKCATATRNDRFEASEVTPFWLKGAKNHFNDFGDGLQEPVRATTCANKWQASAPPSSRFLEKSNVK